MIDPIVILAALGLVAATVAVALGLPAATAGGSMSPRVGRADALAIAVAVALAATIAAAAWLQVGPWHRATADHLRGRAFELIEREFLYRQEVHQNVVALMERAHRQEITALRGRYEGEITSLRERYQEAWEALAQNSEQLIRSVALQFGLNGDFLAAVAARESGFDPGIANALSGARGLFQFMPATWNEMGRLYAEEIAAAGLVYEPVTAANRGDDADPRNNARLNAVLGAMLARFNMEATGSTDPAILYLAHFAGPEMARYVATNLEAQPDQPIREVLRQIMPNLADAVIEQNAPAYREETTLADFYQWSAAHFAGIPSALADPDATRP